MGMENMSVENVKKFREELQTNKELKKKLEDLKLGYENLEELVSFANKAGFDFTLEELKAVNSGAFAAELSLDELDKVVGGFTDEEGRLITTIAFGCEYWTPATNRLWLAVKGQCGSCMYWSYPPVGMWLFFGYPGKCICPANIPKKEESF